MIWQAVVLLCFITFSIGMYIGGHIAIDMIIEKQKTSRDEFVDRAEALAKKIITENIELRSKLGLPLSKEDEVFLKMSEEGIAK